MADNVEVWLWLLLVMKAYNTKTHEILEKYNYDCVEAAKAIRDGDVPHLSEDEKRRAKTIRNGDVNAVLKLCYNNNVQIITYENDLYPKALKSIFNPPILLFCAGRLDNFNNEFSISVVGMREPTQYAYRIVDYILPPLVKLGTVIVSGLARGLDTEAHLACLNNGGRTIGVCACGILTDYPKGSGALKRRIVEEGGCIISELLPLEGTSGEYFKFRNRIIAGLSHGTLVIEAGERSGCFLTANHALEQGREVFAVPPNNIMDNAHNGTASLIRDGAISVFNYLDILHAFYKDGGLERYFKYE